MQLTNLLFHEIEVAADECRKFEPANIFEFSGDQFSVYFTIRERIWRTVSHAIDHAGCELIQRSDGDRVYCVLQQGKNVHPFVLSRAMEQDLAGLLGKVTVARRFGAFTIWYKDIADCASEVQVSRSPVAVAC